MKIIGDDIYIQRGETWSLDFDVNNDKGDPYMLFLHLENPYIAITVAAARYEQRGDLRTTYWLDMNKLLVQQQDGSFVSEARKRFISTEALYADSFDTDADDLIATYGIANGGMMVVDATSDYDVTNYLFYIDANNDGERVYKYIKSYTLSGTRATSLVWETYDFRIVKYFTTKTWMEQGYLFDIKLLAGESVKEHIARLIDPSADLTSVNDWSDTYTQQQINLITDEKARAEMQDLFDDGVPLMPDYDIKSLILEPTNLYVSANIQGGVK